MNDEVAAYRWLLAEVIKPEHIVFSGDSAGGDSGLQMVGRRRNGVVFGSSRQPDRLLQARNISRRSLRIWGN
jgi:hypothetical protein